MRKAKTYFATRGDLTAEGATKAEAKANLDAMINWACQYRHPLVENRFGLLIVISHSSHGWQSIVIDPASRQHGGRWESFCGQGMGDYGDVLASARMHAAQNAWTPAADDEQHIALAGIAAKEGELRRWIAFQRRYLAAKAQGRSDNDSWNIAAAA